MRKLISVFLLFLSPAAFASLQVKTIHVQCGLNESYDGAMFFDNDVSMWKQNFSYINYKCIGTVSSAGIVTGKQ